MQILVILTKLQNGRAAIKAPRALFEGKSALSQTKTQAYNVIKNASFSGEKQKWVFKMYITFYQRSHQILEEYGKTVPPAKQVQDLINKINCSKRMMDETLAT